jgi:RNA polymerase-binding transcription factor DksA
VRWQAWRRKAVHSDRYSKETQMEHGERFDEYVKQAAQNEAVRYEEEVYHICERCESPIEALLLAALHQAQQNWLRELPVPQHGQAKPSPCV